MKIIVYGTLMKGFYNYDRWMGNAECINKIQLHGFKLFINGYPAIIQSNSQDDIVHAELYDITKDRFEAISAMEIGAGYHIEMYKINGEEIPLFAMNKSQVENGRWKLVENGVFSKT